MHSWNVGQQLDRNVDVYIGESCHYDEYELVCVYCLLAIQDNQYLNLHFGRLA